MTCPKCGKVGKQGMASHINKCQGTNGASKSPLERYDALLAQIEVAKKELLEEKDRLNSAAKQIEDLLAAKSPYTPAA